jgi:hypothetical protein
MVNRTAQQPTEVLDAYFLETRAKLIEIAATLDRLDRANAVHAGERIPVADERLAFVRKALDVLKSDASNRAELLQQLYSKE